MFPNFAIDPQTVGQVWPDYHIDPAALARFRTVRNAALVGEDTMKKFGWRVGQNVTLRGSVFPVDLTFEIVGVIPTRLQTGGNTIFWFNRKYLEEAMESQGGLKYVGMIWVRADRPEHGRRHHRAGRRALQQLRGGGGRGDREVVHRQLHELVRRASCASSWSSASSSWAPSC